MLSQTSQHALRALGYIASVEQGKRVGSAAIARASDVPHGFLLKILNTMTVRGILLSTRGVGGGFQLARPAENISMYEIVTTFENLSRTTPGLLGGVPPESPDLRAMDSTIRRQFDELLHFLRTTTLDAFSLEDFNRHLHPEAGRDDTTNTEDTD
ncbi:iron-responsive transcriptional regulator [bacterium BMS3Bbin04]|nr:iron-responsive transcriptional regulator [bacterium BMS3Bbin04]